MRSPPPDGSTGDRRQSDTNDDEPLLHTDVEREVTRVESVRYLEGASGHGLFSLVFLLAAVVLVRLDAVGAAAVTVVVAFGVALNGVSIHVWDVLRVSLASRFERDDEPASGTTRTLRPHRLSPETKAELLTGFVMVGGFVVCLVVALSIVRAAVPDARSLVYLAAGALAAADLAGLWWARYAS